MYRKILLSCLIFFSCLYFLSCKKDDSSNIEESEVPYDLRTGSYWVLASTPQGQPGLFPNGNISNNLQYNFGRARLAWYFIDNIFYDGNSSTPPNITADMLSLHSMREVLETEIFPNKQIASGIPASLKTFDLTYFPNERGPYNYDVNSIANDGSLRNPVSNWAGIMRKIETTDFEAANIEYIELWLMDPYADDINNPPNGGTIYLHLGDISEDILRDGYLSYENGYPKDEPTSEDNSIKTAWGYAPSSNPKNYAYDNDPDSRKYQDIGFDGLSNTQERSFFKDVFLDKLSPDAYSKFISDPSGDDFKFFRGASLDSANADIIERYKYYENPQGNSTASSTNDEFHITVSLGADTEDINYNFTLDDNEAYYQYAIKIKPKDDASMQVGQNYIVDKNKVQIALKNGKTEEVVWYQFKIPVQDFEKRIGTISNFKSIRFMRLVMTQFEAPVVCRFAKFQLIRED